MALAYYNEIDEYAAQWLRNLIDAKHIAYGVVDTRSIVEVRADELRGFTQCHFFAGIGGWSLAARLAGWPDDRRLWTGSCPCQPFSIANAAHRRRKGQQDERHLFPVWFKLIRERKPPVVFGEQVKDAIAFGWLDEVFDAMEHLDYACRAVTAPACSVRAPQERERLWFVCDADSDGHERVGQLGADAAAREGINPWGQAVRAGRAYRGKTWLVEPGIRRLADGVSADVASLRAFGNAIVPQVAAEIIGAYMDCAP
jgi:DNA (cytosine-5)-methyltransferase 1